MASMKGAFNRIFKERLKTMMNADSRFPTRGRRKAGQLASGTPVVARERRERAWADATDERGPPNRERRREWQAGASHAT